MATSDLTRSAVLALLGASGPLSRAEIARSLEVSPATVTQVTKDLLARRLVGEVERAPSQGGRPGQHLALIGSAGHAVGVKVAEDHLALVDAGLDGVVRSSWTREFDGTSHAAIDELAAAIAEHLAAVEHADVPLLGVGVGVPGSVPDQAEGVVHAPTIGWSDVQLGARLRRALAVPVLVENDVNALAVAERLYGYGRHHRDLLLLTVGSGIGASLLANGTVYRGSRGGAGEVGHVPVKPGGQACACGARGCLEAYAGGQGLIRAAREAGLRRTRKVEDLWLLADQGDARAAQVFVDAAQMLGRVAAGLVNVLDPEIIVVLGEGTQGWRFWQDAFEQAMRAQLLPLRRAIPVEVGDWDDTSWALGAAALVLGTPFDVARAAGDQGAMVRARLNGAAKTAVPVRS
jgi:predicted NBD/HSP70 family sugar kinase